MDPSGFEDFPSEATAEDIERAKVALSDDDEPVSNLVLAKLIGTSERTIQRWSGNGCSGPAAKLIHFLIAVDEGRAALSPPP